LEAYCKGGQGPRQAVAPPKKKKKGFEGLGLVSVIKL